MFQSMTAVTRRANANIEDADIDTILQRPAGTEHRRNSRQFDAGPTKADIERASAKFESMVSQVEEQLNRDQVQAQVLRKGEPIPENVPPRGSRRYKIPLPSRPSEVHVALKLRGGKGPLMWGSVSATNPNSDNFEFKGKDEKILYRHVIPPGEDESGVDRRTVAPSCRDLYVTVEAGLADCQYDISVAFAPVNVIMSRKELSLQVAKLHQSWETRLLDLQHDPVGREDFDAKVKDMHNAIAKKKRDFAKNLNILKRNKGQARENTMELKLIKIHKRALQKCARQEAVALRRAQMAQTGSLICHTPIVASEVPKLDVVNEATETE